MTLSMPAAGSAATSFSTAATRALSAASSGRATRIAALPPAIHGIASQLAMALPSAVSRISPALMNGTNKLVVRAVGAKP